MPTPFAAFPSREEAKPITISRAIIAYRASRHGDGVLAGHATFSRGAQLQY
jgi:hypothetical protein